MAYLVPVAVNYLRGLRGLNAITYVKTHKTGPDAQEVLSECQLLLLLLLHHNGSRLGSDLSSLTPAPTSPLVQCGICGERLPSNTSLYHHPWFAWALKTPSVHMINKSNMVTLEI